LGGPVPRLLAAEHGPMPNQNAFIDRRCMPMRSHATFSVRGWRLLCKLCHFRWFPRRIVTWFAGCAGNRMRPPTAREPGP